VSDELLIHTGAGIGTRRKFPLAVRLVTVQTIVVLTLNLEAWSEINKIIDASYRELFKGVAEKDVETRKQLMAPYNRWLDEHEGGGGDKDIKSVATHIQRCKDQMASMVCV
jgi:hypothetical protein